MYGKILWVSRTHAVVYTDHQSLRSSAPSGPMGIAFKVKYIFGRSNIIGDTLSKPPCNDDDANSCPICTVNVTLPNFDGKDYLQKQLADNPELGIIITTLLVETMKESFDDSRWVNRGHLLNNGLLYRCNQNIQ